MQRTVQIIIEGPLRGKARIRSKGRQFFKDGKTRKAETQIAWAAKLAMNGSKPFTGPVTLDIIIHKLPPKSWPKAKREAAHYVVGKPDWDNTGKLISDALNGIVYVDDSQVAEGHVRRRYGPKDVTCVLVTALPESAWVTRKGLAKA